MRIGPRPASEKRPNNTGQTTRRSRHDAQYGRTKEKAAMCALGLRELPPWLKSYRRANLKEDLEGKDLVIETTAGPIFIQIKSSAEECFRFRQKPRNFIYDVVLIKSVEDLEAIRTDLLNRAERLYRMLWREMRKMKKSA
ncbi:hypothetical protein HZC53_04510 [Candidatus Uhrbacteria bacterium]|nr:hypothetical protein [Candidatus Uhrbacteria bacterium]